MNQRREQRAIIAWTRHEGRVKRPISSPDRNGLPVLRPLEETTEEREARENIARRAGKTVLEEIFYILSENLGPIAAKNMFVTASKLPPHRRKGTADSIVEAALLAALDHEAHLLDGKKPSIRALALRLHASSHGELGNSAEAIEKHIRRLLRRTDFEMTRQNESALLLASVRRKVLNKKPQKRGKKDRKSGT